jgi:hypothetical protein
VHDRALNRRRLLGGAAAFGAGAFAPADPLAAPAAAAPAAEAERTAGTYPPTPAHLIEAQYLVDHLRLPGSPAANNAYRDAGEATIVTWGEPRHLDGWRVRAQCASFLTAVLARAYAWATDEFFDRHFQSASPFARDFRRVWAEARIPHFERINSVAALEPGDLIAIDYRNGQPTNTGHVVMVRQLKAPYTAPGSTLNFPGETQYPVEIVDCTSDPHGEDRLAGYDAYPDTRLDTGVPDDGAGYGHMMFYGANGGGAFTRYRWSVNSSSANTFTVAQRPIVAVRVS